MKSENGNNPETRSSAAADVDAVMKKFDRESNTRIWTGTPGLIVKIITIAFSVWCIYVTLFATFLEEIRLTSFLGLIILLGFLVYPAKKGDIRENHMPWYDMVLMALGVCSFFYFTFNANAIVQQGTRFAPYQIAIGIVGIIILLELTRRCVGIPILIVALIFVVYALGIGLTNPSFFGRVRYFVRNIFYT